MQNPCETQVRLEMDREHNVVAAALSLVLPGLGHMYKGHYGAGFGILLSLATLGLGLIIPVCFWAMTGVCAYYSEDRRAHHPLNVF